MESDQATTKSARWNERIHVLGVGALAGAIVGIVTGIGARVNMRIIALATGSTPELSSATFFILLTGLLYGILPGILYVAIKQYLPGPGLVKGLLFGLLGSLLIGLPIFLLPDSPTNDLSIGPPLLGRSLFTALPIIYGVFLGLVEQLLRHSIPRPAVSQNSGCLYGILALLTLGALFRGLFDGLSMLHQLGAI
jgi:hypothetical protein